MYFAPTLLRKELDQYYTPQELVNFIVESIEITPTTTFIDPCGGSGDFLAGVIKKALLKKILGPLSADPVLGYKPRCF